MTSEEKYLYFSQCFNPNDFEYYIVYALDCIEFAWFTLFISFFSLCNGTYLQAEVIVDASVVRSGRNLSVIALEFKLKKTGDLIYTARATFYHMPASKL